MKTILFLLAVVALLFLLRSSARRIRGGAKKPPAAPTALPMATCLQCGLHLPRDEALPGKGGLFCGEAHRAEFERTHPGP